MNFEEFKKEYESIRNEFITAKTSNESKREELMKIIDNFDRWLRMKNFQDNIDYYTNKIADFLMSKKTDNDDGVEIAKQLGIKTNEPKTPDENETVDLSHLLPMVAYYCECETTDLHKCLEWNIWYVFYNKFLRKYLKRTLISERAEKKIESIQTLKKDEKDDIFLKQCNILLKGYEMLKAGSIVDILSEY